MAEDEAHEVVTRARLSALGLALGLALAVAVLAGCGDDEEPASQTASTPRGEIELSIRFEDGAGNTKTATLTCRTDLQRAGGYLRDAAPASELCAAVRSIEELLTTEPDKQRVCSQIYGGPETARVTGTIDGVEVDRRFTRTNGCEIADYRRAGALLPP